MSDRAQAGPSRRGVFAGAAGIAAAGLLAADAATSRRGGGAGAGRVVAFDGVHQAGIATPAQDRLVFAAFDVAGTRAELAGLLADWTAAARAMTAGLPVGGDLPPAAPPADTGEARDLDPSRLTLTVGFGPSLFDGRFGLAARRPAALEALPPLPGDTLDPARCGGDLAVQACADDPQVAFHAVRNLTRLGRGVVRLRWVQLGFGRTSATGARQQTPRNLMGFRDGTNNIRGEDTAAMDRHVWVGGETDQPWMRGGTYLVARRIRMLVESWDRASLAEQERVIGRHRSSGAPLGREREHDPVDLRARGADGEPVVPVDAHVRLAAPSANGGVRILRRGYSYTDGVDPRTGQLDAGLFFVCFQRDPRRQFVPMQRRLGRHDALREYVRHTGGGVFACPPGVGRGDWWGRGLLG